MSTVPRAANGTFLPPQFRLDSAPAHRLAVGDVVSWNWYGRAEVCRVWQVAPLPNGRVLLVIEDPIAKCGRSRVVDPDTTVNRVEVLRG